MRQFSRIVMSSMFAFAFFMSGCEPQKASQPQAGRVEATEAYLQHFGMPPQGKEGRAYARVLYLPVKDSPGKVRALPVFLFDEDGQLSKILDRLTGGELLLPQDSALYDPFPADFDVVAGPPQNGVLELTLKTQQVWNDEDQRAAGLSLAETALQFAEVQSVHIRLNGQPLSFMPVGGFEHNPGGLAEVPPPTLTLIAGMWEDGAEAPAELLVEFDRPVKVNHFLLRNAEGNRVEGDYYTSIFEMAVVVHPKNPGAYREGTVLQAEWHVVDVLGRSGKGATTLPLKRFEH